MMVSASRAMAAARHATLRCLACGLVMSAVLGLLPPWPHAALANEPAEAGQSLDDELLRDLAEEDAKEESAPGEEKAKPPSKPGRSATERAKPESEPTDLTDDLLRDLDEPAPDEASDEDPLSKLGRSMRRVEELIGDKQTDREVQQLQKQIVAELDKLLAQSKRPPRGGGSSSSSQGSRRDRPDQQQSSSGSGGEAPDQPAGNSTADLKARAARTPDMAQMKSVLQELWGHLPERERQRVINSTIDKFVPKYELMIEDYFKRLAEEQRREP